MPRPSDLAVEAVSGAVAAVAVAILIERVHAWRSGRRARFQDADDNGAPRRTRSKLAEFLAAHVAFRLVMGAARAGANTLRRPASA